MTSRILLRQQLMREQMHEQERREQQQKFMQQRVPVSQTPAINVSVPPTLPAATQVPMEVLKVRGRRGGARARPLQNLSPFQVSCFSDRVWSSRPLRALSVTLDSSVPLRCKGRTPARRRLKSPSLRGGGLLSFLRNLKCE